MRHIYVVGTADTKGEELAFLARTVADQGGAPLLVDVGIRPATIPVDIGAAEVAAFGQPGLRQGNDRGTAVAAMAEAFAAFVSIRDDIAGMVGIGGSGGTSIVSAGMRALPIGVPKLMVSTLASGNTAPFVDVTDIVMMPAITDMAGLNRISRVVLAQAAAAITAMSDVARPVAGDAPAIGLTMFGVTTPAVTAIADLLRGPFEPVIFHATGTGGSTMERLVDAGLLQGVLDITTTEVADLLFGGILPARPNRLDCIARTGAPYVGSLGACDMVNFGARSTVPAGLEGRRFYQHNAEVTLMRTTPDECREIGRWIGTKLSACRGPVRMLIPERGVSALDIEGGAFWDPQADRAMFEALTETLLPGDNRRIERLPLHINDPAFARAAADAFREIAA